MFGARQLPVHSPLPLGAVRAALAAGDPRPALAHELRIEYSAEDVLLTASGTVALTLAMLAAAARRPGAPVAIPGYACYDLVTAAVGARVPVVVYDLDPRTLAPDSRSLRNALARGAGALVVVHLFGVPVPMDVMRDEADRAGAILIEDAAQATGGGWDSRPLGAHGDLAVLSFGRGKGTTGGGGGALLLRGAGEIGPDVRARLIDSSTSLAPFTAKLLAQWALGRPAMYGIPASLPALRLGETIYKDPPSLQGMAAASARVLACTRPLARDEASVRRANASVLIDGLRSGAGERAMGTTIDIAERGEPGWLRLPIRTPVATALREEGARLGWAPSYPQPLLALPALAPLVVQAGETPGSAELARSLSTVPTHSLLTSRTRAALVRWLVRAVAGSPPQ